MRSTEPGIHTPHYSSWVVWSRIRRQLSSFSLQATFLNHDPHGSLLTQYLFIKVPQNRNPCLDSQLSQIFTPTYTAFYTSSTLSLFGLHILNFQGAAHWLTPEQLSLQELSTGLSPGCLNLNLASLRHRAHVTTPVPTPPLIAVPLVQISLCSDYFSRENLSLGFCQRSVGICEADSAQILEGSGEWL